MEQRWPTAERERECEPRADKGSLVEGSLVAEYSLTRHACTGEWVAIGNIVNRGGGWRSPAWIGVGIAETRGEAVADLRAQLRHAAEQLTIAH